MAKKMNSSSFQPVISGFGQAIVVIGAGAAQQVEQLPELRARRILAGGAVAQHCGKAVVKKHAFSGSGFDCANAMRQV